jgi:hypothetical protein
MQITNTKALMLGSLGLLGGIAITAAVQTYAAGATTTVPNATGTPSQVASGVRPHGHAPLGGDGNITAINGTTITMQEESDEGGASYTIDASKATVANNGTASTLSALQVGDKIFVQGTTNGNNVTAAAISLGHPHHHGFFSGPDTRSPSAQ